MKMSPIYFICVVVAVLFPSIAIAEESFACKHVCGNLKECSLFGMIFCLPDCFFLPSTDCDYSEREDCKQVNETCEKDSNCCDTHLHRCSRRRKKCCKRMKSLCTSDDECCSQNCINGECCKALGNPCAHHNQCCSGACEKVEESAKGICAEKIIRDYMNTGSQSLEMAPEPNFFQSTDALYSGQPLLLPQRVAVEPLMPQDMHSAVTSPAQSDVLPQPVQLLIYPNELSNNQPACTTVSGSSCAVDEDCCEEGSRCSKSKVCCQTTLSSCSKYNDCCGRFTDCVDGKCCRMHSASCKSDKQCCSKNCVIPYMSNKGTCGKVLQ